MLNSTIDFPGYHHRQGNSTMQKERQNNYLSALDIHAFQLALFTETPRKFFLRFCSHFQVFVARWYFTHRGEGMHNRREGPSIAGPWTVLAFDKWVFAKLRCQNLVFDGQVDAAYGCLIKLDLPIDCEEHGALVVFYIPEETDHDANVGIVVGGTLLRESFRLVYKEHGFDVFGNLENGFKLWLERIGVTMVDNKLTGRYLN